MYKNHHELISLQNSALKSHKCSTFMQVEVKPGFCDPERVSQFLLNRGVTVPLREVIDAKVM